MPRILFNMPSQYAGQHSGVAHVAFQLLEKLIDNNRFDYFLRSPWSKEQVPEFLRSKPFHLITIPRSPVLLFDVLWQTITFPGYCRREGIDLVVNLDPFGAASGGRARLMIVHDLYFRTIPEQIGWRAAFTNDLIFRLMLRGNSEIVTVSNSTKRDLEFCYPGARGRTTTIHSATSLKAADGESEQPEIPGSYILAVGNATKNKNFHVLAEAMAKNHLSFPDLALVHVGNDPDEILAKTLNGLSSKVRLIRRSGIDDTRLANIYKNATCLCVTSLSEGFCLPVLEAQVSGCPVVCADRSAMPEIAGKGALLFDATDSAALASCLRQVLLNPETKDTLIRFGYENATRFSWDIAARQYEELFEQMLARPSCVGNRGWNRGKPVDREQ